MAVANTQQEEEVLNVIENELKLQHYSIVRVRIKRRGHEKTLQIMIEKEDDNSVDIKDCEIVTKMISPMLDELDIIKGRYNLEVSSPGIDRPLTRKKDFEKNINNNIRVKTYSRINGKKNLIGKLISVYDDTIVINENEIDNGKVTINFDLISEAYLINN